MLSLSVMKDQQIEVQICRRDSDPCPWYGYRTLSLNQNPKLSPRDASRPPGPEAETALSDLQASEQVRGLPAWTDKPGKEF